MEFKQNFKEVAYGDAKLGTLLLCPAAEGRRSMIGVRAREGTSHRFVVLKDFRDGAPSEPCVVPGPVNPTVVMDITSAYRLEPSADPKAYEEVWIQHAPTGTLLVKSGGALLVVGESDEGRRPRRLLLNLLTGALEGLRELTTNAVSAWSIVSVAPTHGCEILIEFAADKAEPGGEAPSSA